MLPEIQYQQLPGLRQLVLLRSLLLLPVLQIQIHFLAVRFLDRVAQVMKIAYPVVVECRFRFRWTKASGCHHNRRPSQPTSIFFR